MSELKHPGKIEMVDAERDTSHTVDAAGAPPSVAFVDGRPVTKIVKSRRGDDVVLRSYGADGALLSTTVGRAG